MKSIPNDAEDVTDNPTAINNDAASNESATSGIPTGSGDNQETQLHGFSKSVAELRKANGEQLGWNAAILLRYLSYRVRKHGKDINGKRRVRINLDHIAARYPYMGRTTVDENLIALEHLGCCEIESHNSAFGQPKYDRTRCYHVPRVWMDRSENDLRYFDSTVAAQVGVPAAVIYFNFCYWIGVCEAKAFAQRVNLAPATLVELQPFSKPTIKRAIRQLIKHGYIQASGSNCWYAVGNINNAGSNPDEVGSKADKTGSKADETGSKADNDICYSNLVDSLKNNSKTDQPSAVVFVNSSDATKQTDQKDYSSQSSITTSPDGQDEVGMEHNQQTSLSPFDYISHDEEQQASPADDTIAPSTCDISDEVENVEGEWPYIASWEQLHATNRNYAEYVKAISEKQDNEAKFLSTISNICNGVLATIDGETATTLYDDADPDVVVDTLLPIYQAFLQNTALRANRTLFDIFYYGAFECLVGSFLWPKDGDSYSHPMNLLIRVTYRIHLKLWRYSQDVYEKEVKDEFAERRQEFASVDADDEHDADLSPAAKARVFRNALSSRNKVGWIFYDGSHRTDVIKVGQGLKGIQRLFELNETLTPAALLTVMDACMKKYCDEPALRTFTRGVCWHARRGHKVGFFASYLRTIVKQLDMPSPVDNFLTNEPDIAEDECSVEEAMAA